MNLREKNITCNFAWCNIRGPSACIGVYLGRFATPVDINLDKSIYIVNKMLLVQNFRIQYFSYLKEYALIFFFGKVKFLKAKRDSTSRLKLKICS